MKEFLLDVYRICEEALSIPILYLLDPEKRIYYLYLLSSLLLALFVYLKTKRKESFLKYILHPKVWWSRSAKVDYKITFFNGFIKVLLIGPYLIGGLYLAFYTQEFMLNRFGYPETSLSVTQTLVLYTIALTVVNDFFAFLVHYAMHKIPWLWEFHKVHHSATSLNPVTQYRVHPLELILNNIRYTLVFGVLTGLFDYWSVHQVSKWMFLGVNVFAFAFMFLGANLRHSHVKLKFPSFLEYIFISPVQHQVHHSSNPAHYDKNLGSKFALWDWLFGTLVLSKQAGKLRFGLGKENRDFQSLRKNLSNPFVRIWRLTFARSK